MFAAVWRGERPLWELFWLWWIVGGSFVAVAGLVLAFFILLSIEPSVLPWFSPFLGALLVLPYQIWAIVGVIRGALAAPPPWRQVTLAFMVLWVLVVPALMFLAPFVVVK